MKGHPDQIGEQGVSVRQQTGAEDAPSDAPIVAVRTRSQQGIWKVLTVLGVAGGLATLGAVSTTGRARADDDKNAPANNPDKPGKQEERNPQKPPAVGSVKAELPKDLKAAAVSSPSNVAAVGSVETAEVPKEWRWLYDGVNGIFHVVLEPTEDGTTKFRIEVVKSHRVKPEKAPKGTAAKTAYPKTENEARGFIVRLLAKWEVSTVEDQEKYLSGALFREGLRKFERVTTR